MVFGMARAISRHSPSRGSNGLAGLPKCSRALEGTVELSKCLSFGKPFCISDRRKMMIEPTEIGILIGFSGIDALW